MESKQYTVVDNGSFIDFIGVAGTSAEGLTFSLQKLNIARLSSKTVGGTLSFWMADGNIVSFAYGQLINPDTGLPFADIATALAYFQDIGVVVLGGGSAITADGDTMYSNVSGDFTATVTDGTKDITIAFEPAGLTGFTEANIVSLYLINSTPELIALPISGCTVALGVITVNEFADDFALGDVVLVTLQGPKKAYNKVYDAVKTLTQNPEYGHTTPPQVLANAVTTPIALILTAQNGAPSTDTFENDGLITPYGEDNMLLGGNVVNETKGENTTSTSITANTNVIGTLSNGASWELGDVGLFEGVRRYVASMDTYKYITIHYRLRAGAQDLLTFRVIGTNDANANSSSRTGWVDMSQFFLGAASIQVTGSSVEDIIMPTTPVTLEKIMLEVTALVADSIVPADIEHTFIVKKA
jgi:hypothetical protein